MHENLAGKVTADNGNSLTVSAVNDTSRSISSSDAAADGSRRFHNSPRTVLHLFSGPADRQDGFGAALQTLGFACDEFDLVNGESQNLTSDSVWTKILHDIEAGKYDGMLAGPPCNTFTNARRDDGQGPVPLRGALGEDRYGLSHLSLADWEKTKIGTLLACRTVEGAKAMHKLRRPFIIEQPKWKKDDKHVSMYNLDEFTELLELEGVSCLELSQCRFGAKTTKPTTLMVYLVDTTFMNKECNHPKQLWIKPSTGEKIWAAHPPLVGKEWYIEASHWNRNMLLSPKDAKQKFLHAPYLTSGAQAYPGEFNEALAKAVCSMVKTPSASSGVYELQL